MRRRRAKSKRGEQTKRGREKQEADERKIRLQERGREMGEDGLGCGNEQTRGTRVNPFRKQPVIYQLLARRTSAKPHQTAGQTS